jgi:hypothetical protein
MVTLEMYKLAFYFTVIWLVIGIVIICCSMIGHIMKKQPGKGDRKWH